MSETNWGPSAVGTPLENGKDLESFHEPVLQAELLDFLQPGPKQLYLDGTVGGGGHARQILEACEDCLLLAVDRDLHKEYRRQRQMCIRDSSSSSRSGCSG